MKNEPKQKKSRQHAKRNAIDWFGDFKCDLVKSTEFMRGRASRIGADALGQFYMGGDGISPRRITLNQAIDEWTLLQGVSENMDTDILAFLKALRQRLTAATAALLH